MIIIIIVIISIPSVSSDIQMLDFKLTSLNGTFIAQIPRSISSLRLSQSQMSRVNPVVTSADSTGSHDRIQDMQGQLQLLEARLKSELAQKDVLLSANAALERDMLKHVKGSQKSGNVSRELMDVIEQQSHQYQRLRSLIQEVQVVPQIYHDSSF